MSRSQPKHFNLGVGAEALVLLDAKGTLCAQQALNTSNDIVGAEGINWLANFNAVLNQITEKLSASTSLNVFVADDWARYFLLQAVSGVRSLADLKAVAENRFDQLFGGQANAWQLEADWRMQGNMLICGLPKVLLNSLLEALKPHPQLRLKSMQTEAVNTLNAEPKIGANQWVCHFSANHFLALLAEKNSLKIVRQFRFHTRPSAQEVLAKLDTELLRNALNRPENIIFSGLSPDITPLAGHTKLSVIGAPKYATNATEVWASAEDAYRLAQAGVSV